MFARTAVPRRRGTSPLRRVARTPLRNNSRHHQDSLRSVSATDRATYEYCQYMCEDLRVLPKSLDSLLIQSLASHMRITYLHQYFTTPSSRGGTRSYEFARRWAAAGHQVDIISGYSADQEKPRSASVRLDGFTVHYVPVEYENGMDRRSRLMSFGRFATHATVLARKLSPDVVYATSTPLTITIPAWGSTIFSKTPYVFEVRDQWPDVPIAMGYLENPISRRAAIAMESLAYRRAAHIVALAPGMRQDIVGKGIAPSKVSVVPQGCDVDIFDLGEADRVRRSNPWLGDRPVVLYAGTIGRANGVRYLVDMASRTVREQPELCFVVLGEGAERNAVEEYARSLGLLGVNVYFLGGKPKPEVADWMAASSLTLGLLCGPRVVWKDAVSNKFFDSLAAGIPIASNFDGWQTQLSIESGVGFELPQNCPREGARIVMERLRDRDWLAAVPAELGLLG